MLVQFTKTLYTLDQFDSKSFDANTVCGNTFYASRSLRKTLYTLEQFDSKSFDANTVCGNAFYARVVYANTLYARTV